MADLLYEDAHVSLLHADRGSEGPLLVTFSDLVYQPLPGRFSADVPAEKLGLSALGVVARSPNWHPAASVTAAARAAQAVLERHATRVCYGGSMGGYGAIRFSGAFRATHVLAMCPQVSIDPATCGRTDPRFARFFGPGSGGDAIRAEHVCGEVFVFYDPAHAIDSWNVARIGEAVPGLQRIRTWFSGHHTTSVLAGVGRMKSLLDHALAGDAAALHREATATRRSHDLRARVLLESAAARHPALCARVLEGLKRRREALGYPERFWTWAETAAF